MTRTIGAFVLLGSLVLGACGVGDETVETDDRDEQLGILCEATFTTTGTFAAGVPARPAEEMGCWPVGTWTFTAKVDQNACDQAPSVLASYSFKVDRAVYPDPTKDEGYVESYTWLGGTELKVRKVGVSALADGCQGGIEADNLRAAHNEMFGLLFRHDVEAARHGSAGSPYVRPESLDTLSRRFLREAFRAIGKVQTRLEAEWVSRLR